MDNLQIDARLEEMDEERLEIRKIMRYKKIVNALFTVMGFFLLISALIVFIFPRVAKDFTEDISNNYFHIMPYIWVPIFVLIFIFASIFSALYFTNLKKIKNFENQYKTRILTPILNQFFPGCSYFPDKEINYSHFEHLDFLFFNNHQSNDFISGTHNNINFCSADVKLTDEDSDSTRCLFNGRWVILDLNLNFKGKIEIYQKNKEKIYRTNYLFEKEGRTKKYTTSNKEFNDEFVVYAMSQEIIDYILTPEFLNNLLNFSKTTDKSFIVILSQGMLNFGVDDRENLMELKYEKNNEKEIYSLIKQTERRMSFITKFINSMDLNNVLKNNNLIQ